MNSPATIPAPPKLASNSLPPKSSRRNNWRLWIGAGAALVLILGLGFYLLFVGRSLGDSYSGPVWTVGRERLQINIVERGTLESAENSDIFCRVKMGGKNAITIKWIIDDGSQVERGQKLVDLDDSALQDSLKTQLIAVNKARSDWIQAEENYHIVLSQANSDIETAKIAIRLAELDLQKYQEGDYIQTRKDIEGRIQVALSDREQWLDRSSWSTRMVRKGYLSRSQAESDRARLESSEIALNKVQEEMSLLEKYTKIRTVIDLESKLEEAKRALERTKTQAKAKITQAEIERESKRAVYLQEDAKRLEIEEEIHKCVIYSPQDGLVVYFVPEQSRFGSGSQQSIVAQGEPVREGQRLMRIPNLHRMQVNTRVHEAMVSKLRGEILKPTGFTDQLRVGLISRPDALAGLTSVALFQGVENHFRDKDFEVLYPGQKALIRIEAFPTRIYTGNVKNIANVASQSDFLTSDVKVYQTIVNMEGKVEGLKPGMSAEVTIQANQSKQEVKTVPIQAVVGTISMGSKRKVFVLDENKRARERDVVVGMSNDKVVEIVEGLEEGEKVVLNPRPLLVGERATLRPGTPGGKTGGADAEAGEGAKKNKKAKTKTVPPPEAPANP